MMFKIGDRVTLKSHNKYSGVIVTRNGNGYDIKFDDPLLTMVLWYNEKDLIPEGGTTMDNPFIETVTTKRIKKGYYDGEWVGAADVFLESTPGGINLVIGADPNQMASCFFDKWTLGNLLKILQEVHDVMED